MTMPETTPQSVPQGLPVGGDAQLITLTDAAAAKVVELRSREGKSDAALRLFVKSGTLTVKQSKSTKETVTAAVGDGAITSRVLLLTNTGTSGAVRTTAASS